MQAEIVECRRALVGHDLDQFTVLGREFGSGLKIDETQDLILDLEGDNDGTSSQEVVLDGLALD